MVHIREAKDGDEGQIKELYTLLSPKDDYPVLTGRIQALAESERDYLLVAEVDGRIVGTLTVNVCPNGAFGDLNYGVMENFVVSSEKRGLGIGQSLYDYAYSMVKEKRCSKLMVLTLSDSKAAQALFQKNGFEADGSVGLKRYMTDELEG
ncbi:GNAT family N-acetyltransferase [Salisediminibacterium selenitireducens]|uniref:GCN5-related N-acetyltransferase n=1 Tax=Bacillus selenitireducens (strain ATCC 700615 / DSM 15326 / MLS10) TaxID=439292 RepID=D6Y0L0_BACIE|nr:GNAT family N-acetyltransferase [Salisediminibacterium selenitireducens]ADI00578.1 GCN5-related N-acetyltransferase [[Bacillus] selenitireducens MLS10]